MTRTPLHPTVLRTRSTVLTVAALTAALLVAVPGSAYAEPDDVDIDELNDRAEELEESYDGELLQYTEIKDRVEEAEEDLEEIEERLESSRTGVSSIASAQYKNNTGFDPTFQVVFSSEPENMFSDAATLSYLGEAQAEQISELIETRDEQEEVTEELSEEMSDAADLVAELEEESDEVEDRIEEYEAEQIPETPGNGSIPDSARGGGWPETTPRMAAIRDELIQTYGAPYPVGCYRPSAQDHGSGRACDFMMSAGGAVPSAENTSLGDQISQHAIDNADRMGVKYIIWKQRIWQSTSRQWVFMNDRGDNTQNHYDHVHISSY